MSDFILREAADEDQEEEEEERESNDFVTVSDEEFLDDETEFEDQNPSNYYGFTDVVKAYDDAMQDCLSDFNFDQEANNYNVDELPEERIDEFDNFNEKIRKFKKNLFFPKSNQDENSFFYSILYALRYHLTEELDQVSDDYFTTNDLEIYQKIYCLKDFLKLDLKISSFEDQCYTVNHILNKNNLFLRVYEQKEKFRYITNTEKDKKENYKRNIILC